MICRFCFYCVGAFSWAFVVVGVVFIHVSFRFHSNFKQGCMAQETGEAGGGGGGQRPGGGRRCGRGGEGRMAFLRCIVIEASQVLQSRLVAELVLVLQVNQTNANASASDSHTHTHCGWCYSRFDSCRTKSRLKSSQACVYSPESQLYSQRASQAHITQTLTNPKPSDFPTLRLVRHFILFYRANKNNNGNNMEWCFCNCLCFTRCLGFAVPLH